LRDCYRAGEIPDDQDVRWLCAAVDAIEQGTPADAALGLRPQPGHRDFAMRLAVAKRDAALREAAHRVGGDVVLLAAQLQRFEAVTWPRVRGDEACPERFEGRIESLFWTALRSYPRTVGPKQLRRILGT
jgi:hypothetical protein